MALFRLIGRNSVGREEGSTSGNFVFLCESVGINMFHYHLFLLELDYFFLETLKLKQKEMVGKMTNFMSKTMPR